MQTLDVAVERAGATSPGARAYVRHSRIFRGVEPSGEDPRVLADYTRHVRALIVAHDIAVRPALHWLRSRAWPLHRIAWLSPCHSAELYALDLHEFGHLIDPGGSYCCVENGCPDARGGYVWAGAEIEAWRWARTAAGDRWTPAMQTWLARCLWSYRGSMTPEQLRDADALIGGDFRRRYPPLAPRRSPRS
jgi:hypothetical protein